MFWIAGLADSMDDYGYVRHVCTMAVSLVPTPFLLILQ